MSLMHLSHDEADRICELDGKYFIQKAKEEMGNRWGGRKCDTIRQYPIFELTVKKGPDGKPDRSGESGFRFYFYALNCDDRDVEIATTSIPIDEHEIDNLPYLQIKTKSVRYVDGKFVYPTTYVPDTIVLYPIISLHPLKEVSE